MSLLKKIRKFLQSEVKEDNSLIMILNNENNSRVRRKQWYGLGNADFRCGEANGYVAIPPSHSLYGKDYEFVNQIKGFEIHGGLTYSAMASEINNSKNRKDFVIIGDRHLPDNWWVFGFDTLHHGDNLKNWNYFYCTCETVKLKRQLEKYQSVKPVLKDNL